MKKICLILSISIFTLFFGGSFVEAVSDSGEVFGDGTILGQKVEVKDHTSDCKGTALRCLSETIIEYLKKLIIPIAIVSLSYGGLYLLIARNDEEVFKKRKNEVFGVFAGFLVILLAATLIDKMFFGMEGEILNGDGNDVLAKNILTEIDGLVSFLQMFVVPIGVLMIIFSAFRLVFRSDDDEEVTKMKNRIIYVLVGIAVILSTGEIVKSLAGGAPIKVPDAEPLIKVAVSWINYILSFLGVIGVFVIVWAGTQLALHFGDEEKVESSKNIIKFVIIGLIIGFSAWTIVRFFLTAGN